MILKKLITLKEKFRWNKESTGPVGRLSTEGLSEFFEIYKQELGKVPMLNTKRNIHEVLFRT
jgi:hypothetical protein